MNERLKKIKTNQFVLLIWIAIVSFVYLFFLGNSYHDTYTTKERIPWVILALIFTLITHELIHGLFASILCRCKMKITIKKDPMGIPS